MRAILLSVQVLRFGSRTSRHSWTNILGPFTAKPEVNDTLLAITLKVRSMTQGPTSPVGGFLGVEFDVKTIGRGEAPLLCQCFPSYTTTRFRSMLPSAPPCCWRSIFLASLHVSTASAHPLKNGLVQ